MSAENKHIISRKVNGHCGCFPFVQTDLKCSEQYNSLCRIIYSQSSYSHGHKVLTWEFIFRSVWNGSDPVAEL